MGIDDAEWASLVCCSMLAPGSTHPFLFLPLHWTEKVFADEVPRCVDCGGIVKPGEVSARHSCRQWDHMHITSFHEHVMNAISISFQCHVLVISLSCVYHMYDMPL